MWGIGCKSKAVKNCAEVSLRNAHPLLTKRENRSRSHGNSRGWICRNSKAAFVSEGRLEFSGGAGSPLPVVGAHGVTRPTTLRTWRRGGLGLGLRRAGIHDDARVLVVGHKRGVRGFELGHEVVHLIVQHPHRRQGIYRNDGELVLFWNSIEPLLLKCQDCDTSVADCETVPPLNTES